MPDSRTERGKDPRSVGIVKPLVLNTDEPLVIDFVCQTVDDAVKIIGASAWSGVLHMTVVALENVGQLLMCQIAGPCNAPVPREMGRAARRWLSRGPFVMPERKEDINDDWPDFMQGARPAGGRIVINGHGDLDDVGDIPF